MKRIILLAVVGTGLLALGADAQTSPCLVTPDPHAYFDALVSSESHLPGVSRLATWKTRSAAFRTTDLTSISGGTL